MKHVRPAQAARRTPLLLMALWVIATPAKAAPAPTQALSATDFLDCIGINTHLGTPDIGSSGTTYNNLSNVIRELSIIKIRHVRDALKIGKDLAKLIQLHAALGVTFDLVYDYYGHDNGTTVLHDALTNVAPHADLIEAFEGPNEPDWFGITYNGVSGARAVAAAQQALYAGVKADPRIAATPVWCPALSYPAGGGMATAIGDLSSFCEAATSHPYTLNLSLGPHLTYDYLVFWTDFASKLTAPGRPKIITETGWSTTPNLADGVDEATQAKYMLTYLFDAFSLGIRKTYLYELAEESIDPGNANVQLHFGVFRYDGTPKPAAQALVTLNTLLGGAGFAPRALTYSLTGLPQNGHQLLLQKSDGTFVLALWNEAYLWDGVTHQASPHADVPVRLTLAAGPARLERHDPLIGAQATQAPEQATGLTVMVPDHPVFVFITPPTGSPDEQGRK